MPEDLEVFENEEAERLLNYFTAFKKLSKTADYFRRAAAENREISFSEHFQTISPSQVETESIQALQAAIHI